MPTIPTARWERELNHLASSEEVYSIALNDQREIVVRVPEVAGGSGVQIEITLRHGYPEVAPAVRASPIDSAAPHKYADGRLCVFGMMVRWNPGHDSVISAIHAARKWLQGYHEWTQEGSWPAGLQ